MHLRRPAKHFKCILVAFYAMVWNHFLHLLSVCSHCLMFPIPFLSPQHLYKIKILVPVDIYMCDPRTDLQSDLKNNVFPHHTLPSLFLFSF